MSSLHLRTRLTIDDDDGPTRSQQEAAALYRTTIGLRAELGGGHSQEAADRRSERSVLLQESGLPDEAEAEARTARGMYTRLFGESHEFTATCLNKWAL